MNVKTFKGHIIDYIDYVPTIIANIHNNVASGAPLAHRLGLFPIKTELEDLSFKYEHPEMYAEIEAKLAANKNAQMATFEQTRYLIVQIVFLICR